jgi:hypothetical protein
MNLHTYLHTYHSRFIPEGVAEVFQIFLRDIHVLPKLVSYEEYCSVTGDKPIAVSLQSISGVSAINLYSPFTTSMEEREVLFFYFISDDTRLYEFSFTYLHHKYFNKSDII